MKKITLTVLLGIFTFGCAFSQMSFNGSKLTKSAFSLTTGSEDKSVKENTALDKKIVITDEEEEMMKRRKRRGSRGGDYSNSLKTNPLSMIFGYYGLTFERKLADQMSAALTLGLYARSTGVMMAGVGVEYKYSGFTLNPEFRYYFESAIEGWYVSPYITFTSTTETITESDGTDIYTYKNKYTIYGGGAGFGRQWIWGGFTLDLFAGIAYTSYSVTYDETYLTPLAGGLSFDGILPAFGAAIGYSF